MEKEIKLAKKMITVKSSKWEKYGKRRVYFQMSEGGRNNMAVVDQLCWDCQTKEFVSCKSDFRNDKLYSNQVWEEFRKNLLEAFAEEI